MLIFSYLLTKLLLEQDLSVHFWFITKIVKKPL